MKNCPNCGAPITSNKCEYCNTVIYNKDDTKKELLLELKRLETEAHKLKFKLAYDEMMAVARCGNTGVTVGSEWCGLCRVHGCEGYKSYKQKCKNKK